MDIPRHWRLRKQRYGLVGEVCEEEGRDPHYIFPPRDVCPECNEEAKTPYSFSGKGEVYSHTTIYDAPAGFEDFIPYVVALISLAEGPMVTAMMTDVGSSDVEIGMQVEMVNRKLRDATNERGMIVYGYKFRPVMVEENGSGMIYKNKVDQTMTLNHKLSREI